MPVKYWHGGQLVIAWIGLAILAALIFAAGALGTDSLNTLRYRGERQADSLFLLSMQKKDSVPAGCTVDSPLHFNTDAFRGVSSDLFTVYMTAKRCDLLSERRIYARSAVTERFESYTSAVAIIVLLFPFALFVTGLVMTWKWFGYRSPRRPDVKQDAA